MRAGDMELGDIVRTAADSFDHARVINKTDKVVRLFRPYVRTSDFKYTGGVIPYIGIEEWEVEIDRDVPYVVLETGFIFK
jgi:hypothetical protein